MKNIDNNIIDPNVLKNFLIFSELSDQEIQIIAEKIKRITLVEGEYLFHQGDPTNGFYLLEKGYLAAVKMESDGTEHRVGKIHAGESVGELGVINDNPRALSIYARRECTLLYLDLQDFEYFKTHVPNLLLQFAKLIGKRLANSIHLFNFKERHNVHNILLLGIGAHNANNIKNFNELQNKLQSNLLAYCSKYCLITENDFKKQICLNIHESDITIWLDNMEHGQNMVIYLATEQNNQWAQICMQRTDKLYIVTNLEDSSEEILNSYNKIYDKFLDNELILLRNTKDIAIGATSKWLKLKKIKSHHHINLSDNLEIARLCRFIIEAPIGLVLSGGGGRFWAHIGVLNALFELRVPIDIISGVSSGASVAAYFAKKYLDFDPNDNIFMEYGIRMQNSVNKLSEYTFPNISINRGHQILHTLKKGLGENSLIEDLPINFFSIAVNLSKAELEISTEGELWLALRKSLSVPGIFPPVTINGQIFVDGGVINNLPVDIMRKKIGNKGKIIAVDISNTGLLNNNYDMPLEINIAQSIKYMLLKKYRGKSCSIKEILFSSIFTAATSNIKENEKYADLLIRPEISEYGMIERADKNKIKHLLKKGYDAAIEQQEEIIKLISY